MTETVPDHSFTDRGPAAESIVARQRRSDLADNHAQCTLASWHQPTVNISAGPVSSAEGQAANACWQVLYQLGADVVLNGHDHDDARFAPMNPAGTPDPKRIREFIVGTAA